MVVAILLFHTRDKRKINDGLYDTDKNYKGTGCFGATSMHVTASERKFAILFGVSFKTKGFK